MDGLIGYGSNQTASYQEPKMATAPTLKQRLEFAVVEAEQRLTEAKEARDIFDRNPDLERLLNIMQKGRF